MKHQYPVPPVIARSVEGQFPKNNISTPKNQISLIPIHSGSFVESYIQSNGKNYLLYGDSPIFKLSLILAATAIRYGGTIAIVDGCNRFDVHAIIRYAQEQHLAPDTLLRRMFISRGFTCYQMEAALSAKLPAFLKKRNSHTAIVFGLLDTFYDEQAPFREVKPMLNRLLDVFMEMKNEGISLLFTSTKWNVLPKERNQLFETLKNGMDNVYYFDEAGEKQLQLYREEQRTLSPKKGT